MKAMDVWLVLMKGDGQLVLFLLLLLLLLLPRPPPPALPPTSKVIKV